LTGKSPKKPEPEALREQLFAAVEAQDELSLLQLCEEHEEQIAQHFPTWRNIPEDVRSNPALLQRYAGGLMGVARCFAGRLDRPDLLELLQGGADGGESPIRHWQQTMARVRPLIDSFQFGEAIDLLSREIEAVRLLRGGDADRMHAIALGALAECHFHRGAAREGIAPAQAAHSLCWQNQDREGVLAYTGMLYELHRCVEAVRSAAFYARQRADLLKQAGDEAQARRLQRLAALVEMGEPRNRVVASIDGADYELDEVPKGNSGSIELRFVRNRRSLAPVEALVRQGEALGTRGQFDQAAEVLKRAAAMDPHDPEPRYKLGLTLLYSRRYAEAIEQYRSVEALAPGWYQVRTDLWLAERLFEGALPHEAFVALVSLEGSSDLAGKEALAREWLRALPDFAPLHHALGRVLAALGRPAEAGESYDRGLQLAREPDLMTRLLVARAMIEPQESPLRAELLGRASALNGSLLAGAMASVALGIARPLERDPKAVREYDKVRIVNMADGTVIEGHDAVKAHFDSEEKLFREHGASLIFQVYRLNLQAMTLADFQGPKLAEITVHSGFASGGDTAAAVARKVRALIAERSAVRIDDAEQVSLVFSGQRMRDGGLFYADHYVALPAWVQVMLHAGTVEEVMAVVRKLSGSRLH
jgi:tetratricopeptide (TPR) repeat protein